MWWRVALQVYIQQQMWMHLVQEKTWYLYLQGLIIFIKLKSLLSLTSYFLVPGQYPLDTLMLPTEPDAADIWVSHYANFTHSQKKQHKFAPESNDENDSTLSTSSNQVKEDILLNILLAIMVLNQKNNLFWLIFWATNIMWVLPHKFMLQNLMCGFKNLKKVIFKGSNSNLGTCIKRKTGKLNQWSLTIKLSFMASLKFTSHHLHFVQ